jgi:hypothetical protein
MRRYSSAIIVLLLVAACGGPEPDTRMAENGEDILGAGAPRYELPGNQSGPDFRDVAVSSNQATGNVTTGATDNTTIGNSVALHEFCEILQDRIPPAECAYYREIWSRLSPGRGALDVPQQMMRDQSYRVSFALTRSSAPEAAESFLDSPAERTATLRIGRRMAVRLDGEGFTIRPDGLTERDTAAAGAARWDWSVTPQRRGRLTLTLSAYVVVQPPDGERAENLIRTLSQNVEVEVPRNLRAKEKIEESKAFLGLATEWLVALAAAIGVGAFGVWTAIRKFGGSRGNANGGDKSPDS